MTDTRFILQSYPCELRIDNMTGGCRYVRGTEWRVTDTDHGTTASFWTKAKAVSHMRKLRKAEATS